MKDDFRLIVENPRIKDFQTFIDSIDSKFFAFPDYPYLHYWRPMSLFSFYLDYRLWGLNPSGYHLTNIVINALNALLIFLIFYVVSKKIRFSFLVGLFFSLHPSHVEAASWISGRTDLLGALFILTAVLFFILFLKKKKWRFYAGAAFFFILALLSKENSVLFPLLAGGAVLFNPADESSGTANARLKRLPVTLPFWIIDILYLFVHDRFSGVGGVLANVSLKDIFVVFKTIGAYTKTILFPFFPTPHFSMHQFDRGHLEYLVYFAAALLILTLVVIKRENYNASLYSLLFFIFLLPVLDPEIVPSYPKIVIRFAYIPAVWAGVFFLETLELFKHKRLKRLYVVFLVLIAAIWTFESYTFQVYYRDQPTHYKKLARHYPEDCSLLLPLALIKAQEGDFNSALAAADRALAVNHKDPWLDVSEMGGLLKANLLVITGRQEQGKKLADDIMAATKKDEMKYFGCLVLAKYHEKKGDLSTALHMLEQAEKIGETADLYYRITIIYGKMQDYGRALSYLEKARQLNPALEKYGELRRFLLNQADIKRQKNDK